jgi:hypothetical protein
MIKQQRASSSNKSPSGSISLDDPDCYNTNQNITTKSSEIGIFLENQIEHAFNVFLLKMHRGKPSYKQHRR